MGSASPLLRSVAAVIAAGVLAAGCGNADAEGTGPDDITEFPVDLLPEKVLGLDVAQEDIEATLAGARNTYLEQISLYSFREDDLLMATLEVARLIEEADIERLEFRQNLANQVGNAVPRALQMRNQTVYVTSGTRQGLAIWFLDDFMFVLATREDYEQPRALLRALIDVKP